MKSVPTRDTKPNQEPSADPERDLTARLLSGDVESIDAVISAGSAGVSARDLHATVRDRELIERKLQATVMGYHELKNQIKGIMRTLEAAALINASDPLPGYLAEATFAVRYLLREEDLVPDTVPGLGLADDAILVKRVVARHGRTLFRDAQ